jgi:predicted lipoprotein
MRVATVTAVLGLIFPLFLTAPASADTTPEQYRSIVESTITKYLRPEFSALTVETEALSEAMDNLCAAPSAAQQEAAKQSFDKVLIAWSRVEYARLGPVIDKKRLERFSFWPDPKGIGLRQVQKILKDKDERATQAATLAGKSVATQGLQALEFVLFGTGSEALASGDDFRCRYGAAIADNLDAIAKEILAGWNGESGYVGLMRKPGPDNGVYRNEGEAANDIIEMLTTGFQFIRDVKIGNFLGDHPAKAKPRQAAFWRSAQTFAAIEANFAGLMALWDASGLRAVLETQPAGSEQPGGAGIIGSIDFEFAGAERALAKGFKPLEEAVKDPVEHNRIGYLSIVAGSLWRFFAEDVSGLLGLRMGFNALDGD